MRQQLGDFGAALAALLELPRAAEQLLAGAVDEAVLDVAGVFAAAEPGQFVPPFFRFNDQPRTPEKSSGNSSRSI